MERLETVRFTLEFDKSKYEEFKAIIKDIKHVELDLGEGDTLTINYELCLLYFDCLKQIEAITTIARKYGSSVLHCSVSELEYGESLFVSMLDLFHEIKEAQ